MHNRIHLAESFAKTQPSHRPLPAARRFTLSLAAAAVFLVLLALAVSTSRASSFPYAPASNRPHPAVARIIAPEQGAVSMGSGTLVHVEGECGLVVTNWHVVRDATGEISVVFPDGFRSPARVAKVDRDWDLAALIIWKPHAEPVRIADGAPQIGQFLTIAGYGSGDYLAQSGRCTNYYSPVTPGMSLPNELVEISAQARQGDSGGPIFNERGELAGVLFGAATGSTMGSYSGRVRRFLTAVAPRLGQIDASSIAATTSPPPTQPPTQPPTDGWRAREEARVAAAPAAAPQNTIPPNTTASAASAFPLFEPAPATTATFDEPVASLAPTRDITHPESKPSARVTPPSIMAPPITANRSEAPLGEGEAISLAPEEASDAEPVASASGAFWDDFAGVSLLDQTKTFLAVFGVVAFAYHAVRLTAARRNDEE